MRRATRFVTSFFTIALLCKTEISMAACRGLKLQFVDVGEGDAAVLQLPSKKTIVVDTGNPDSVFNLVELLKREKINSISDLILTHPHLDHIGGVFALLHLFKVQRIFDNGEPIADAPTDPDFERWYSDAVRHGTNYKVLSRGDRFQYGDLQLEILSPASMLTSHDWNRNSIVIRVTYGEFSALLMGDANVATEEALLKAHIPLNATLLKAGHHGAADTASQSFVNAVRPSLVILSVNKGNIRNYPNMDVLQRYQNAGAKILRTDRDGTIEICAKQNGKLSFEAQ